MAKLSLIHLKGNTYFIPSPVNVGVYVTDGSAVMIDSGNDSEFGRQALRLLNEQGWDLRLIVNTHSNADHIGGNAFLQQRTGCGIAATRAEAAFMENPVLEPAFLYGGFPSNELRNKLLMAKPSVVTSIIASSGQILDTALEAVPLPGHFFDMIGVTTPDRVFFAADSLFSESTISKYHVFYLLDIKAHLQTLDFLSRVQAEVFIPSHAEPTESLASLIEMNRDKVKEIAAKVLGICKTYTSTENVVQQLASAYGFLLNSTQYALLSNVVRSYLTYLYDDGLLQCHFSDGRLLYKAT